MLVHSVRTLRHSGAGLGFRRAHVRTARMNSLCYTGAQRRLITQIPYVQPYSSGR